MWSYEVADPVLLHLYYVPVVLTGFFLGSYRARLMSLLCILTSTIIFVPYITQSSFHSVPLITVSVFVLWAVTLLLIGVMVGRLSDGWQSSLAELTEAHKKDVLTDALTGVANRRAYEFELTRRLSEWKRRRAPAALVLLDIDYFKKFNDRYGHQAGDAVLRGVARVLQGSVRQCDLVARYGGEEFGLIMPGSGEIEAKEVAERIRSSIETCRFPFNGLKLRVTVSVGVACVEFDEALDAFTQRADAALYSSKEAGRNCAHFHDGRSCHLFGNGIATEMAEMFSGDVPGLRPVDAYTDEITGLPTQKVFLEELRRRVAERNRYGTNTAVAIVHLEHSSVDVDQESHAQKSLIATTAKLAVSVLRDTELIVRYDAQSLAVLLPRTNLQSALVPLRRLVQHASDYHDAKYASLSYGVRIAAVEIIKAESPGETLQRLESALRHVLDQSDSSLVIHNGKKCHVAPTTLPTQ